MSLRVFIAEREIVHTMQFNGEWASPLSHWTKPPSSVTPLHSPPHPLQPPPQIQRLVRSELYSASKEWNFSSLTFTLISFHSDDIACCLRPFGKDSLNHSNSKRFCHVNTAVECVLNRQVILVLRKWKGRWNNAKTQPDFWFGYQ
jgi:hypothetical protein